MNACGLPAIAGDATEDRRAIGQLLLDYFRGLYTGDVELLRSVFHPLAASFADIDGQAFHKPVDAWLDGVAKRVSPVALGEQCRMRVLSLDVLHTIAVAKVHVPARGFDYYNYLSLLRHGGRWLIVNKLFDDLPPPLPGPAGQALNHLKVKP